MITLHTWVEKSSNFGIAFIATLKSSCRRKKLLQAAHQENGSDQENLSYHFIYQIRKTIKKTIQAENQEIQENQIKKTIWYIILYMKIMKSIISIADQTNSFENSVKTVKSDSLRLTHVIDIRDKNLK